MVKPFVSQERQLQRDVKFFAEIAHEMVGCSDPAPFKEKRADINARQERLRLFIKETLAEKRAALGNGE